MSAISFTQKSVQYVQRIAEFVLHIHSHTAVIISTFSNSIPFSFRMKCIIMGSEARSSVSSSANGYSKDCI